MMMKDRAGIHFLLEIFKTFFGLKKSLVGDIRKFAGDKNLNRSEFITILDIFEGGPRTMGQLSEVTDLEKGSVTTLIDNLSEKGYVARKPDQKDRRISKVSLTERGTEFVKNVDGFIKANFDKNFKKLSEKDRESFFRSMDTLRKTIKKMREKNN